VSGRRISLDRATDQPVHLEAKRLDFERLIDHKSER